MNRRIRNVNIGSKEKIKMSSGALEKLLAMAEIMEDFEVRAIALASRPGGIIDDFYIPSQQVEAASVKSQGMQWMEENIEINNNGLIPVGVCHSHGRGGVFHSPTDNENFDKIIDYTGNTRKKEYISLHLNPVPALCRDKYRIESFGRIRMEAYVPANTFSRDALERLLRNMEVNILKKDTGHASSIVVNNKRSMYGIKRVREVNFLYFPEDIPAVRINEENYGNVKYIDIVDDGKTRRKYISFGPGNARRAAEGENQIISYFLDSGSINMSCLYLDVVMKGASRYEAEKLRENMEIRLLKGVEGVFKRIKGKDGKTADIESKENFFYLPGELQILPEDFPSQMKGDVPEYFHISQDAMEKRYSLEAVVEVVEDSKNTGIDRDEIVKSLSEKVSFRNISEYQKPLAFRKRLAPEISPATVPYEEEVFHEERQDSCEEKQETEPSVISRVKRVLNTPMGSLGRQISPSYEKKHSMGPKKWDNPPGPVKFDPDNYFEELFSLYKEKSDTSSYIKLDSATNNLENILEQIADYIRPQQEKCIRDILTRNKVQIRRMKPFREKEIKEKYERIKSECRKTQFSEMDGHLLSTLCISLRDIVGSLYSLDMKEEAAEADEMLSSARKYYMKSDYRKEKIKNNLKKEYEELQNREIGGIHACAGSNASLRSLTENYRGLTRDLRNFGLYEEAEKTEQTMNNMKAGFGSYPGSRTPECSSIHPWVTF